MVEQSERLSRDNKENHFKKCDCEEEERLKAPSGGKILKFKMEDS